MTSRTLAGLFRLAIGATLLVALGFQIVDKITHNDMLTAEYYSFFTIQSSFIAAAVSLWGGVVALRHPLDGQILTAVRMSVLTYAIVTAGVYNGLLRGIPAEGYVGLPCPGELMHVWVPVAILVDWLLSPGRSRLRWTALRVVISYPIAWLVYTFIKGAATGWYPYPFLEPSTGFLSITVYVLAIAAFVIGIASLAIAHSRRSSPGEEATV